MPVLVQGAEKYESKKAHFTGRVLAKNPSRNGRSFTWQKAGRGGQRHREGEEDDLIRAQDVGRSDIGTGGADIQGLGEIDELGSGGVCPTDKNRNLQANARRKPCWRKGHARFFFESIKFHWGSLSTKGLVRLLASWMPECLCASTAKGHVMSWI